MRPSKKLNISVFGVTAMRGPTVTTSDVGAIPLRNTEKTTVQWHRTVTGSHENAPPVVRENVETDQPVAREEDVTIAPRGSTKTGTRAATIPETPATVVIAHADANIKDGEGVTDIAEGRRIILKIVRSVYLLMFKVQVWCLK